MRELTPPQRLRVTAAVMPEDDVVRLNRAQALQLVRDWEAAEAALAAMPIIRAAEARRQEQVDALISWNFRVVTLMGAMQAIAAWALAGW